MKWSLIISLLVILVVLIGCTSTPPTTSPTTPETSEPAASITPTPAATESSTSTPTSTPTTPTDTTPPSAITGLIANDAYDTRVNLWWDKSTATDFDHYNIYLNKTEMVDVTDMQSIQQIQGIATCSYQVTGLEDGTNYYLAVTAVDKSGNEDTQVTSAIVTSSAMPGGTTDPELAVDVYQPDKVWAGTTLLPLNYDSQRRRIVEVNMLGEIVWEYLVPQLGFIEAELLSNNNILYTVGHGTGIYEVDRSGKVVWSYMTSKVDHDADRLPNGNTLFVFGFEDQKSDAQVVEVNPKGEVVWEWYAKDHFDIPPYDSIYNEGWTHTNAVTRLPNGNTLISLRNFNFIAEVDPQGAVVRTIGEDILIEQHDPEILPNGNILATSLPRGEPHSAVEIDPKTGRIVWEYLIPNRNNWPVRDANRLPNGNTIITGVAEIVEVTPQGEIVWRLRLQGVNWTTIEEAANGFYKADRISTQQ